MYGDIIKEQERRHFIEKVEETKLPTNRPVHYIPHHPVSKESSTTPIRIVYDCSCKDGRDNPSLNECLESHPPVMNDITGILMRFRAKKYATTSDLEKAFLQIQLDEKDRDATETERKKDLLRSDEIENAKFLWIRYTQGKIFSDEINCIDNSTKRKTLVRQLKKLFLDEKQLLRCGGRRIDNATVGETVKFPYLLPAKDRLTHLIVLEAHENTLHSGINITLAYIQQTFWIPKLRQCVKSILMKCVTCRKVIGKSYPAPEIPPLPKERVQDATPFSITGVDFTGALTTRNRHNEESKVYICLFTCAVTRAVHLELVYDLSEESFLLCFRRFVSRRSVPKIMMSDNALTFKAASNEISRLCNSRKVKENIQNYGIEWKFIPNRAPWFGGMWERMIGLRKY
ncbi:uncharacterized protein LOC134705828 [Mytilus trossulus]|uniref:uncharacterized protein LOC134705828 n=1 Tax=Mytilus trossulus TaxID=6551 RepID=UPI00300656F5